MFACIRVGRFVGTDFNQPCRLKIPIFGIKSNCLGAMALFQNQLLSKWTYS